ncbi:MAG: glutathione S-transferase family protein [Pseudomonadales bacterium]|nr:glutathione S-transferase family protein [Pseudomonadales bacterium]
MLKLHGFAISNYYNIVKHAMIIKGLEFEEVFAPPSQESEMLAKSPMGKIPFLETENGILTEANVILEYLEETYPEVPLYPADPFERARVKQVIKTIELYIETPAHDLIGFLFGREVAEQTKENSTIMLDRGIPALNRLVSISTYICGDTLTAADIFAFYSFKLANNATKVTYGRDVVAEVPGLKGAMDLLEQREDTQKVLDENRAALKMMQSAK